MRKLVTVGNIYSRDFIPYTKQSITLFDLAVMAVLKCHKRYFNTLEFFQMFPTLPKNNYSKFLC